MAATQGELAVQTACPRWGTMAGVAFSRVRADASEGSGVMVRSSPTSFR